MPILLQQGPWVSSAPGVIEAIEILESAEQTEDKPLTEREAKLFHCKEVRNQSQMFGCRPLSALSALPVVSRPLLWLCHHVHLSLPFITCVIVQMIESGCKMEDLREYDYQTYMSEEFMKCCSVNAACSALRPHRGQFEATADQLTSCDCRQQIEVC